MCDAAVLELDFTEVLDLLETPDALSIHHVITPCRGIDGTQPDKKNEECVLIPPFLFQEFFLFCSSSLRASVQTETSHILTVTFGEWRFIFAKIGRRIPGKEKRIEN